MFGLPIVIHGYGQVIVVPKESKGKDKACCRHPAQVFEAKEWAALTGRCILPKLAYTLDAEFAVNPVAQDLQPWQWVRPSCPT